MKKRNYIFIILCLICAIAQGQEYTTGDKKAIKLYEKGMTALQQGNGSEAERCLEQALSLDDGFLEAHLTLAEWLLDSKREEEAAKHYRAVVERNATFFTPAWLQLGELELKKGNYDIAEEHFTKFLNLDKRDKKSHAKAEEGIESARFRKEALAHPVPFDPKNLGGTVNSPDDEYLPALTADGQTLVFTRRFPRKATTTATTAEEEDLYVSVLKDGKWGTATRMPEPLNSGDNEGAECISQDGRILFFTACGRNDGGGRCDIYMCTNKGGKWGKPHNLGPMVNSGAWEGQPSFSIDGKTLYFVSNRKGGYGGMDIWKTVFENGKWGEPANLGPEVNSKWDEMSPFIHFDDRTLYFASNRPKGMGGFDIFVVHLDDSGKWGEPENLGYPINTGGDDNNMIVSASGRIALFASDREGGYGKMDLYSFTLPEELRPITTVCMKGTVTNKKSDLPVGADVKIIDLNTGVVVANTSSDAATGAYQVSLPALRNYVIHVSADGYLFYSDEYTLGTGIEADWQWEPDIVNIALHPIESGERVALNNVFFESGRYELLEESFVELEKVVEFLLKNSSVRIEIGGHTDDVGSAESNMKLSEQRAKAVYDWLMGRGVKAERLSYKGYGETQPVASNETDEGRAMNRRTEMKVL